MTHLELLDSFEHFNELLIAGNNDESQLDKMHYAMICYLLGSVYHLKVDLNRLDHILGDDLDPLMVDENGAFKILRRILKLAEEKTLDYQKAKKLFMRCYVSERYKDASL